MGQVAFHVKSILRTIIRKLFILWVACYIIFVREKWPNTLHLKYAFAVVHHSDLIGTHQVLPQLLKILSMTFLIALGHTGVIEINRLFAKHLGDFFQGAAFLSSQKQHTGTVTNNRFGVIFIDCFELRLGLYHNVCGYLTASDDADDMLKVRYLLVCELIQQTGHMDRQCSTASKRFITEDIEHLGVHHRCDKMKGGISIRNHHKQCCFSSPARSISSSSSDIRFRTSAISKGASLAPQEIRMDFAVLPETSCQGLCHLKKHILNYLFSAMKQSLHIG